MGKTFNEITMTKEQIKEELDKYIIEKGIEDTWASYCIDALSDFFLSKIDSLLQSQLEEIKNADNWKIYIKDEIDLALKSHKDELVEKIEKYTQDNEDWFMKDIISLIKQDK